MRRLYTLVLSLLLPFILARLYWKGRRLPGYRSRIPERFFLQTVKPTAVDVWIHAVSLGEVVAATPLIERLLLSEYKLLVTTMTPTGSSQVHRKFGSRVVHQYLPYDLPWIYRRFLTAVSPRLGIILETELWPNLMHQAKILNIPMMLINGRISDKSFKKYMRIRGFFCKVLSKFQVILTQSALDAERFIALGARQVHNVGNLKFDVDPAAGERSGILAIRERCGSERVIVVAASTHAREEQMLLDVLPGLKKVLSGVLLIIAPRHPERFSEVVELSQSMGFITGQRSQLERLHTWVDVVILDSLGELLSVYAASDYAFVGGSLIAIGGHNVLEPIALKVPVCCGPFMHNSSEICDELTQAGAIQRVGSANDLVDYIKLMEERDDLRALQVEQASKILLSHQGSVNRCLEWIQPYLMVQD